MTDAYTLLHDRLIASVRNYGSNVVIPQFDMQVTDQSATLAETQFQSYDWSTRVVDPKHPATQPAVVMKSYFDDYYNQLWLIPTEVDVGALASDIVRTIGMWNAYVKRSVTIVQIDAANASGVFLSGITDGDQLGVLEYKRFELHVTGEGSATIDARFKFDANLDYEPILRVIGSRAKIWPWDHNWKHAYRLNYSYSTEVITSRNGKEQRVANRIKPRQTVETSLQLTDAVLHRYRQLMWSWQDRVFVLPDHTHWMTLTQEIPPGQEYVDMPDGVPFWVREGGSLLLTWQSGREIRDVASVVGNRVNFRATSASVWPVGTRIYSTVSGRVQQNVNDRMPTSRVTEVDFTLIADPSSMPMPYLGQPGLMWDGREVFDKRPNWANNVEVTHNIYQDEFDYGSGPLTFISPWDSGLMMRTQTYLGRDQAEIDEMVAFFNRNRGQQGEFYVPTWEHDFVVPDLSPATSSTLRFPGRDIFDAYAGSPMHKRIVVKMFTGEMYYREILEIAIVTDEAGREYTMFTLDESWPVALTPDNVLFICWVYLCRFASDSLTIEHLTDSVAQFQFTLRTLPDNPPEG